MTEKQYAPTKTEKKISQKKIESPKKIENKEIKQKKEETKEKMEKSEEEKIKETEKIEEKKETKEEVKKPDKKNTSPKVKRDYAIVNGKSLPISTKDAVAICRFIKNKKISKAIEDLEQVSNLKKPIPMRGEIPHRKGKIMSGRFPVNSSKKIIMLLKSLQGNATMHEIENPRIVQAIANTAQRPFGRFGIKRKRTHVTIKAMEIKKTEQKNKKGDKK